MISFNGVVIVYLFCIDVDVSPAVAVRRLFMLSNEAHSFLEDKDGIAIRRNPPNVAIAKLPNDVLLRLHRQTCQNRTGPGIAGRASPAVHGPWAFTDS